MVEPQRFPWARLLQLGVAELGIAPAEFWRCTLREISTALGPATRPLQRQKLEELMAEWPDDCKATRREGTSSGAARHLPQRGRVEVTDSG